MLRVKQMRDELLVMFAAEPIAGRAAGCMVGAGVRAQWDET